MDERVQAKADGLRRLVDDGMKRADEIAGAALVKRLEDEFWADPGLQTATALPSTWVAVGSALEKTLRAALQQAQETLEGGERDG
jgi:hypothetical protein